MLTSCPHCGGPMRFGPSHNPHLAPWNCDLCRRAFFRADLTPKAREGWAPHLGSHELELLEELQDEREKEIKHHEKIGRNFHNQDIVHLSVASLKAIAASPAFDDEIRGLALNSEGK